MSRLINKAERLSAKFSTEVVEYIKEELGEESRTEEFLIKARAVGMCDILMVLKDELVSAGDSSAVAVMLESVLNTTLMHIEAAENNRQQD